MIDNKWFCEPDEQRECWCFLFPQLKDNSVIDGWEIGYGNPSKLTRKIKNKKQNEEQMIRELLCELYHCRKKCITLITYAYDVLLILRTRIILLNIKDACFHGIKHICIEKLLEEYFLCNIIKSSTMIESSNQAEVLWNLFLKIGPMFPVGVI